VSDLPDPAPVRLERLKSGHELLAADACWTCEGTRLVKRGALGLYPHTTAVGPPIDRAVMRLFACPTCNGTGLREPDEIDAELRRRLEG
jgi:hypothetical protein